MNNDAVLLIAHHSVFALVRGIKGKGIDTEMNSLSWDYSVTVK